MGRYKDDRVFEDDVRRIADAVFELPAGTCKPEICQKGKKVFEVDGVARTRDVVHLVMATTSTKLEKVKLDVEKLVAIGEIEAERGNTVKKWMIVHENPEAPHVSYARSRGAELLTFAQFRERFFDGRSYLSKRKNAAFGSARDPDTNSTCVSEDEFLEPPMFDIQSSDEVRLSDIVQRLMDGESVVLLGQFGSGKSLALREVWFALRKRYLAGTFENVPVALNLREHWGAAYADEILRRHGRSIGFEREADLTVAWRAGMLTLLIDGFDEMASQGVASVDSLHVLRQVRQEALLGVRDLVSKAPHDEGILIVGREHYFDDVKELTHTLGLGARAFTIVRVNEFDDATAAEYLRRKGFTSELPTWLPKKALLLGYLARRGLLEQVLSIESSTGQAKAWVEFLSLVCAREAEHDRAAMDPETLQRVLEHLAIQVRASMSGTGPISAAMLSQAYTSVTGQLAGDAVLMQLQRLPGLTERDAGPGARSFIDQDLLEALQGAAVARQLLEGGGKNPVQRLRVATFEDSAWLGPLGALGCAVAAYVLRENGWTPRVVAEVLERYRSSQMGADLLQIALSWAAEEGVVAEFRGVELSGVHVSTLDLDEVTVRGLTIRDSIVNRVVLGMFARESEVTIGDSQVSEVLGIGSRDAIPSSIRFEGMVEVTKYETLNTTDAIIRLDVEDAVKALLSALKKLFRQRGGGRVAGAFHRGIPADVNRFIDPVLRLLVQEGMAWESKGAYHPVRGQARRAHQILDNPRASGDALVTRAKTL